MIANPVFFVLSAVGIAAAFLLSPWWLLVVVLYVLVGGWLSDRPSKRRW